MNNNNLITNMMFWIFLHIVYEKWFHILLKRREYPFIKRRNIIDGIWCIGFALGSMLYLQRFIYVPDKILIDKNQHRPNDLYTLQIFINTRSILHDTFYLHRSFIQLFINGSKLEGWIDLLLFVTVYFWRSFDSTNDLLMYKAVSLMIIDTCRVVFSMMPSHNKWRLFISKLLLGVNILNCVRIIYTAIATDNFKILNTRTLNEHLLFYICVWVFLFSEFFIKNIYNASVGYKSQTGQWMETYLFFSASQTLTEMTQLKDICLKIRKVPALSNDDLSHLEHASKDKTTTLIQTLFCAIALKRKIRKYRETKVNMTSNDNCHSNT